MEETDPAFGWTMSRQIYPFQKGMKKEISRTSQWRTVSLDDIFSYASTKRINLFDWHKDLLKWNTYSLDKKKEIYNKE